MSILVVFQDLTTLKKTAIFALGFELPKAIVFFHEV